MSAAITSVPTASFVKIQKYFEKTPYEKRLSGIQGIIFSPDCPEVMGLQLEKTDVHYFLLGKDTKNLSTSLARSGDPSKAEKIALQRMSAQLELSQIILSQQNADHIVRKWGEEYEFRNRFNIPIIRGLWKNFCVVNTVKPIPNERLLSLEFLSEKKS